MKFPMSALPRDEIGKDIDISEDPLSVKMLRLGEQRTKRFALSMVINKLNLRQALAAAYIQGMADLNVSQTKDNNNDQS